MSNANGHQVIQEVWAGEMVGMAFVFPLKGRGKAEKNWCVEQAIESYLRGLWGHTGCFYFLVFSFGRAGLLKDGPGYETQMKLVMS